MCLSVNGGNMFGKKIKFEIWGFIFTAVLGTLLHFLYEWSGKMPAAALFSPVNESVWEHLKLLFFPFVLFTLWELLRTFPAPACFLPARTLGLSAGLFSIPFLFYCYTSILGTNYLALDILVFLLSILIAFSVSGFIEKKAARSARESGLLCRILLYLSIVVLLVLLALFLFFTFNPPHMPLFRDPVNGSYGN